MKSFLSKLFGKSDETQASEPVKNSFARMDGEHVNVYYDRLTSEIIRRAGKPNAVY
jgi:hypothetical protein